MTGLEAAPLALLIGLSLGAVGGGLIVVPALIFALGFPSPSPWGPPCSSSP